MNNFKTILKPGDTIYVSNIYGSTYEKEVDAVVIGKYESIVYCDRDDNLICTERQLDSTCGGNFRFFTSKSNRDKYIDKILTNK